MSTDECGKNNLCVNLGRIVATMVDQEPLNLIFGCGVGGHRQGCARENIKVKDSLDVPFGQDVLVADTPANHNAARPRREV